MKEISIRVNPPALPAGADNSLGRTHIATSYRISKNPNFNIPEAIIFESLEDSNNLLELSTELDIKDNDTIYVKTKFHYLTSDNTYEQTPWSLASEVTADINKVKYPDTIVKTPTIEPEVDVNGFFTIKTIDKGIFTGKGKHERSNWKIRNSDNVQLYERPNDTDNLTKLKPEFDIENNKAYIVEAEHIYTDDNKTNLARNVLFTHSEGYGLYEFELISKFYIDTTIWHRVKIFVHNFKNYDLQITKPDGDVVRDLQEVPNLVHYISSYEFDKDTTYEWWLRIRFTDDSVTDWKRVHVGLALGEVSNVESETYLSEITDGPQFHIEDSDFNDLSNINSFEISEGHFYWMNNNKIILMKKEADTIKKVKDLYELKQLRNTDTKKNIDTAIIPYASFNKISEFEMLCSYKVLNNNDMYGATVFLRFELDPYALEIKLIDRLELKDEENGYGISNCLVNLDGRSWWATYEQDPTVQPYRLGLKLFKLEVTEHEMIPSTYIVDKSKRWAYAKTVRTKNKEIGIIGGTDGSTTNIDTSELIYKRNINQSLAVVDNVKMIKDTGSNYPSVSKGFTALTDIATINSVTWSTEIYDLMPFSLNSGNIIIFNNSSSGTKLGEHNVLVYNGTTNTFSVEEYKTEMKVPFRNTVKMSNWDLLRISSNVENPQVSYIYLSTLSGNAGEGVSTQVKTYPSRLNMDNEVTLIENPYQFGHDANGITVPANKKLYWNDKQQCREFNSYQTIYSRSLDLTSKKEHVYSANVRSIDILNNVHIKVGLGCIVGETTPEVGRGSNPYPFKPDFAISPVEQELRKGEILEIYIDTSYSDFAVEYVGDANSYITILNKYNDGSTMYVRIRCKGVDGTAQLKFTGLIDEENEDPNPLIFTTVTSSLDPESGPITGFVWKDTDDTLMVDGEKAYIRTNPKRIQVATEESIMMDIETNFPDGAILEAKKESELDPENIQVTTDDKGKVYVNGEPAYIKFVKDWDDKAGTSFESLEMGPEDSEEFYAYTNLPNGLDLLQDYNTDYIEVTEIPLPDGWGTEIINIEPVDKTNNN